jgi:GT2 family glycosyltransferase
MKASVVIRSKDEADRLRLVLASLEAQTVRPEIVVVDDGSSDHTPAVVAEAARHLPLTALRHDVARGRSAASNAGAAAASGDVIVFLDGDTLAAPDFVALHADLHRRRPDSVLRGETWHLRGTRLLLDPEAGTPRRGEETRLARMSDAERARARVTREQIARSFDAIALRGQPGVYPGFGPRKLFELEMEALLAHPTCPVLWAASSGSNSSLPRDRFLAVGGFDPRLDNNEHRELALRLCRVGCRMAATTARSYHMIHRTGWRDPLVERDWETVFYGAHPIAAVALLPVLWASLADTPDIPAPARINSLPELAAAAERCADLTGAEAVRAAHRRWALLEAAQ